MVKTAVVTPLAVVSVALPSVLVPSLNATDPLGAPTPGDATSMVAVNVTESPTIKGLTEVRIVVVVWSLPTVGLCGDEVLAWSFASPA